MQKASLQPVPNADGVLPFGVDGAPPEMFWMLEQVRSSLDNLLLNGMAWTRVSQWELLVLLVIAIIFMLTIVSSMVSVLLLFSP